MADSTAHLGVMVISHMYPQRGRPGYGVFVSEQLRALSQCDVAAVSVAAPVPWAPWPLPSLSARWRTYAYAERERVDFGNVQIRFPRYVSFPRKALRGISARSATHAIVTDGMLADALSCSDVLVAHSALLDGSIAGELSERFAVPYIVVVHGEDLYQNVRANDTNERLRLSVGSVLERAAAIVVVSHALERGIRDAFKTLPPIHVIHNGVDTEIFAPPPPASDPGGSALRLLSAGHLVKRKAHDHVLRALAILAARGVEATLTIAGDGPQREALEALAIELGVSDRVVFFGAYHPEQLPGLLHKTDLFVLPSWDEAFGVVYLEALSCGVPVIAATDGGASEIVDDGVDGFLVPPKDTDPVVEAIARFAGLDTEARASMRDAARAKAVRFTWRANAEALLDVIRLVTKSAGAGTRG